jgi:hypothetical protein
MGSASSFHFGALNPNGAPLIQKQQFKKAAILNFKEWLIF